MMSFIQQFYQDCLVKFALMGIIPRPPDTQHFTDPHFSILLHCNF